MTPDERAARIAGHRAAHELDLLHDGPRQYLDPESCATCWFIDALNAKDEAMAHMADVVTRQGAEVERLNRLLDRIAYPALMYDARVYMLSEDAPELLDRLKPEQRALVGERPSEVARRVETERDEALDNVEWLVRQHCYVEDGVYDTSALSTNRDAFDLLVKAGRAEYVGEQVGRRAFIRFLEGGSS